MVNFRRADPVNFSRAPKASRKTRWFLARSTCPPGAMPAAVETEQSGTTFVTRARGFPDAVGTVSPDGRFTVSSPLGACSGLASERSVTETCGNTLGACTATYHRAR